MPQATTSRAQVRYIAESVFGTIPGTGNPNNLRMAGESLEYAIGTDASKEIRSDRQKTDIIQVSAQAQGGINFELSYAEFDKLLEAVFQGTWSAYGTNGVGTTFSGTMTSTTITAAVAPTGSSAFTTLANGQWFKLNAPGGANDGKYFRVHGSTAPTSTVITLDAATPATAEGPIASCSVATSRLTNGTTERSFAIEKAFTDVNQFFAYRGMTAAKLSMGLQSGQIASGSFGFMGKDCVRAGATQLPGSPTASQTYDVMSAVSGVGQIMEGGSLLTSTFIKSLSFDLDNKLRGRDAIGTLGAVSIGSGTIEMMGTMDVYLADGTLYDKFVANTASSLQLRVVDGAGNGYAIQLPKVKYKDAKVVAGSIDQDAMVTLPFEAVRDPTTGKTVILDRFGAAVT